MIHVLSLTPNAKIIISFYWTNVNTFPKVFEFLKAGFRERRLDRSFMNKYNIDYVTDIDYR
jgi:hypothetical protein